MSEDASAGRLYATVEIDTTGLRGRATAEIKTALAGVTAKVRAELSTTGLATQLRTAIKTADIKAKIPVELRATGLVAQVRALSKLATIQAKVQVDRAQARQEIAGKVAAASKNLKAKVAAELDTSRLAAQARAAARFAEIKAKVTFDRAQIREELTKKIDSAARGVWANVRVDLDDAAARARLNRLRRERITVDVGVNVLSAAAIVEALRRSQEARPIRLPVQVTGSQALTAFGRAMTRLTRFPAIASGVLLAAGAVTNLAASLYSVVAAGSQAVGVLAALPGLVGAAAQGAAGLLLGFSGIGKAVQVLGRAQDQAGQIATTSAGHQSVAADQIRAAQERLARAEESVAERIATARRNLARSQESAAERIAAARQAVERGAESAAERALAAETRLTDVRVAGARRVTDAEKRLSSMHEATTRAQQDLNRAGAAAAERFEDLALAVRDAALDEQDAQVALEHARRKLAAISSPYAEGASDLDRRQAQIDYDKAVLALDKVREHQADLKAEQAEADRTGVQGSREVLEAKERLQDATQSETDAEADLRDARAQAARDAADAAADLAKVRRDNARDIADDQAALLRAQRDGAREIADSQRELRSAQRDGAREIADARRAIVEAMSSGTEAARAQSAAIRNVGIAMGKLGPAGQTFARFIDGTLRPRFYKLRDAVQAALLPPLQKGIIKALPLLDVVEKKLVDTGGVIGALALKSAGVMSTGLFRRDVGKIMGSNNRALKDFGEAGISLVKILKDIAVVAGPILVEPFARWVRTLAKAGETATATGRRTGELADFLGRAKETAKTLLDIGTDLVGTLLNIGRAARPTGDTALADLATWAAKWRDITASPEFQQSAREFFAQALPVAKQFAVFLGRAIEFFIRLAEVTGGDTLDGFFAVLDGVVSLLETLVSLPGGGAVLSAILTLSGAGLALGLTGKALGLIITHFKTLAKFSGLAKLTGSIIGPLTGGLGAGGLAKLTAQQAGGALRGAADTARLRAMYVADAARDLAGSALGAVGTGARRVRDRVAGAARSTRERVGGAVSRGATRVRDFVASRRDAARGRGDRGSATVGALGGDLVAAGIGRAGAAAGRAAKAVGSYTASLAKAGAGALMTGLSKASGAIGGVVSAAGRGIAALNGLSLANLRAGAASAANAVKTAVLTTGQKLAAAATTLWAGAQRVLNLVMLNNPIGWIIGILALLVGAVVLAYQKSATFRKIVDDAWRGIQAAVKVAWEGYILPTLKAFWSFLTNVLAPKVRWFYENIIKPVWSLITGAVKIAVGLITGNFDTVRKGLDQVGKAWSSIWRGIGTLLSNVWNNNVKPLLTSLVNFVIKTVPDSFSRGVELIKGFWQRLQKIAKDPVSFIVNTVYNRGILPVWNWIADRINPSWKLPEIKGFARGGIVPGYTPGRDNALIAVGGGEGILRPELTRALGKDWITGGNRAAIQGGVSGVLRYLAGLGDPSGMGIPAYARGGIVPLRGGGTIPVGGRFAGGGIFSGVSDFFTAAKDWFRDGLRDALTGATTPLLNALKTSFGATQWGQLVHGATAKIIGGAINFLVGHETELGGPGRQAVAAIRKVIGTPYSWGGGGPTGPSRGFAQGAGTVGWDCSSLMQYGWYQAIKKVAPRTTYSQWPWTRHVDSPAEGDLGFMRFNTSGLPEHVVMFAGQGHIVEAPHTGAFVREVSVRPGTQWGRVPETFLRDTGGPVYPGVNLYDNRTGDLEWILNPRAIDLLGGVRAVDALNRGAADAYLNRRGAVVPRAGVASGRPAASAVVHVHPQPHQSEEEIGAIAARRLGVLLG
ncbi:NlpC/P60 family protein [Streptosporangium sp. NPDC051023]|uniref:NlpC/P60 family protein n=1 Tax=Streptosporangium sp. NPDC051023 TaxID=3155410 RepID=UPI00344FB9C8